MASAETCLNCGQELRGDSNYCGVCGTPRHHRERVEFGGKDDPWGDRQVEAEDRALQSNSLEDDRLAGMGTRTWAYLINGLAPSLLVLIPIIGWVVWIGWVTVSLNKWRRGQDIGASLMKIRVVRKNGDVAGFFHMWTRSLAATISLLALGAGFWTAYFDQNNRTWHDKIMGTYVIWDNPASSLRPGTSSSAAVKWFWVTAGLIGLILISSLFTLISWIVQG